MRTDVGPYKCRAFSDAGESSDESNARLAGKNHNNNYLININSVPPRVRVTADHRMIERGDRVVLECTVTAGAPMPTLTWMLNGRVYEIIEFKYYRIEGGRLTIIVCFIIFIY